MPTISIEEFENSSHENGTKVWDAREFMEKLGYESWSAFQSVIRKAMGSCTKLNIDPTEIFEPVTYILDGKNIKSYKLNRFACFMISMHADSRKVEVMQVRALLSAIADRLLEERIQANDIGRIETREDLKLAEIMMSGAAKGAGLESRHFGIFKDAGFRGMYNRSLQELIKYKNAPSNSRLYDYMGLEELAGNLFRVTQTAARVKMQKARGVSQVSKTAREVGREVRQVMIKDGGIAPEDLQIEENISGVRRRIKTAARKMKKLDSRQKRLLKP